jgi:hypothetical protein
MVDQKYKATFEVHIPGDVKPRRVPIAVMAESDSDAYIKSKDEWNRLMKPKSITIEEDGVSND